MGYLSQLQPDPTHSFWEKVCGYVVLKVEKGRLSSCIQYLQNTHCLVSHIVILYV